jgi:saccharopine dehydrogenase-like NADP-dependent oxidoreductase
VDASVAYRKWKEGSDDTFQRRVAAAVEESKAVALDEGVDVPTTIEEYIIQAEPLDAGGAMDEVDFDDEDEFDEVSARACPFVFYV